jgi:hypothetical protein
MLNTTIKVFILFLYFHFIFIFSSKIIIIKDKYTLKINLKKQWNCITKQVLDAPRPKKKKKTNNNQKLEDSFDRAVFTVSTGRRGNLKRALLKTKKPYRQNN